MRHPKRPGGSGVLLWARTIPSRFFADHLEVPK
jgi:hypothetical protein